MIDTEHVYYLFRKAQAESKNKGFRMPKDFEKHLNNRFTEKNRESLITVTKWFNTKWNNIDIYRFMKCGFKLFKTFSYIKFLDERVINLYIVRDKNLKREINLNKKEIMESVKYVKKYMKENNILILRDYCNKKDENNKIVIKHYLLNKIDKFLFVYLIRNGILELNDTDRSYIPYIISQYREILSEIEILKEFFVKIRKIL